MNLKPDSLDRESGFFYFQVAIDQNQLCFGKLRYCGDMGASSKKHDELFQQYLEVCNQALEANKDKFPYKHLWNAAQKLMEDETVPVAVYDDRPKAAYTLQFKDHHIDATQTAPGDEVHPWHVNMSYLEQVVEHPEEYIENPAKIDWDWLRNRLGA